MRGPLWTREISVWPARRGSRERQRTVLYMSFVTLRLKFEQIIERTPRLVLAELIDPRRKSRVRIDRFLTRNLIRPDNRMVRSEFVS